MQSSEMFCLAGGFLAGTIVTSIYYINHYKLFSRLYVGVGHDSYGWYWRLEASAKRFKSKRSAVQNLNSYGIHEYTEE